MPNASQIKSRFLGKRGDPFHQFDRLIRATNELASAVSELPEFYFDLANELVAETQADASRKLLAYRILSTLNQIDNPEYSAAYRDAIFALRRSGFWIEKAFSTTDELNQAENTLFAPQPFHFADGNYSRELRTHIDNRTPETSRNALYNVITRIHETTTSNIDSSETAQKSVFFEPIFGQGLSLLDALGEVHFEASDNATRHALRTDNNKHSFDFVGENFFGDIQYLQMTAISQLAKNPGRLKKWPDAVATYIDMHLERKNAKGGRFLVFSYADNGPGIIEHITRFRPGLVDPSVSLREVINGRMTTSSIDGAGDGLYNMQEAMIGVNGFINIQSGGHTYYFNGINQSAGVGVASRNRGTLLTFIVPA